MSESSNVSPQATDPENPKSLGAHLEDRFGIQVDPQISLSPMDGSEETPLADEAVASQLLRKLAIHTATISRYEIRGEVGRGGMGVILKVWDQDLRRSLAMKVILGKDDSGSDVPSGQVEQSRLTRFLEEAQITGQLNHPGIVPVHELGLDAEGRTFFTMRLVKGRDLKSMFERKQEEGEIWPVARSLGVFVKICETMAYAHSKGVVHRDLKPANVMVGRYGETYVMDWGLAKILGDGSAAAPAEQTAQADLSLVHTERKRPQGDSSKSDELTMDGSVMGTPSFMPPEQALGQLDLIGPWSDIYAVGAMLYQLFTGQAPYMMPGANIGPHGLLAMVMHGPPTPIPELAPHIDRELVSICEKAMARDIAGRYQNMMQMAEDIEAYLGGRVVSAHDTSVLKAFTKLVRRNKGIAAAVTAFVVLGIAASIVLVWQQNETIKRVRVAQRNTEVARDEALASEKRATRQTYVANLTAADVCLRANEIQAAKRRLEDCPEELRGWEWRHLAIKTDTALAVLPHSSAVTCVAFSSDGSRMATGAQDAVVRVWDSHTQTLLLSLEEHDETINALAFSPDGAHLASASADGLVRIWEVASGVMLMTLTGHEDSVTTVAYAPDGSQVATGSSDESIKIWSASSGLTIDTLKGHEGSLTGVAYTPDGRLMVSAADDGSVRIWDAPRRELRGEPISERETKIAALAVSPDGARVALGGSDKGIHLWSLATREQAFVLRGHAAAVTSLAFSFDGRELVSTSLDETVRLWDMESREEVGILKGHDDAVLAVATNADGSRILTSGADATARLWDPGLRDSFLELDQPSYVTSLASSPDGARLVAGSAHPHGVTIWDTASGAELLSLPGVEGDRVTAVAFGPDGSWIVTGGFEDPSLNVIDARTGEVRLGSLTEHLSAITSLAVSADGGRLVSGSDDGTARVWDAGSGEQLARLEDDGLAIFSVACSADAALIATGSMDGTIRLWGASGQVEAVLEGHADSVSALAFDRAGGRLVSGSDDETLRVWDVSGEREPLVLFGHTGPVISVALGPDGSQILSGSRDSTLRLWNADAAESLLTLRGHRLPVTSVAFGGDGQRIFSASFDRTVRIWETNPAPLRHSAQMAARTVAEVLEELGHASPNQALLQRVRQQIRADSRLSESTRQHALRILELRAGS
jgi:WD40 repeat protein/serine/threonine protein kinase